MHVIYDKVTRISRGYGYITYKHMKSAHNALSAPTLHDHKWSSIFRVTWTNHVH